MRSTIMEYGLTMMAVILIMGLFSFFLSLVMDGGGLKEALIDYISTIC